MTDINNENEFRAALNKLDAAQQRVVAAGFVGSVLHLCTDKRIARVMEIAADPGASDADLAEALKTARATTFDCHTRCGSEGDWLEQAGYFVARAAVAALTPLGQMPGGVAWQAAMSARMAQTSKSIVTGEDAAGQESENQYRLLAGFLNT
jgi:hypothetical protein